MIALFLENLGSILLLLGLLALLGLILFFTVKKWRRGGSSCGCGCASCPMAERCHTKEK